jgi:hypothetical protein
MNVGTIKTGNGKETLSICTINSRRVGRSEFKATVSKLVKAGTDMDSRFFDGAVDVSALSEGRVEGIIENIIEKKGRGYGVYKNKELVGIYVYENIDDFFVKVDNTVNFEKTESVFKINDVHEFFEMTDEDLIQNILETSDGFMDKIFGESKAAYRLVLNALNKEVANFSDEIKKYILTDLKEKIEWGYVSGIVWGEELIYRKNLEKKADGAVSGGVCGFWLGVILGWLLFDSFLLGMCWGICFGFCGGLVLSNSGTKQEWASFDFVNKKYTEEN